MSVRHTPGPWRLGLEKGRPPYVVRPGEGGFVVKGLDPDTERADARLIAAAPELLKTLWRLRNAYDRGDLVVKDAALIFDLDTTIAKAEGSS